MKKLIALSLALCLAAPRVSTAQVAPNLGQVQFTGVVGSGSIDGFRVGPYAANLNDFGDGGPSSALLADASNTPIWCVDFTHYANGSFDSYFATAFSGNLVSPAGNGDFSKTRAYASLGNSNTLAENKYRQAAWLIEQYYDGVSGYSNINVQGTLWKMFDGGSAPVSGYSDLFASVPVGPMTLNRDWFVLSDDENGCTRFQNGCASNQEYLTFRERPTGYNTTVPEPSTYVLMASGLMALGVVSRRRRHASAE
jgi:hypothetical protein